ncbi:uncharacterized protein [Drosophila takahashii]|uniref:uncharacterized protein n=1 Tax=Drosophila takahashii TaxID=29030 RepID=UPI0038990748
MQALAPFLHEVKTRNATLVVVRVGGRLANAHIPFDAKHPPILPKDHKFTKLFVEFLHRSNLHAGPKVLLSLLREKMWVVNARDLTRKVVRACTHCFHYQPRLLSQIMGNLPSDRLLGERPFFVTGVDFCGPFMTSYKIRSKSPYKTYASIFVCFTSKAIHIELVTDLTTNSFLSCIRRFIARRGLPRRIVCDNATNFVGAASKLMEFKRAVLSQESISLLESYSACKGAKTLLVKNAAEAHLTYEELLTLLTEIEAILNSRPIAPLSDDPNDGFALTPAHLLIGGPLLSAPEEHLQVSSATDDASQLHSLTRWQRITFLKQQFWRIWQRDFIHTLQKRTKFTQPQDNIRVGQLVIIHEDTAPPQH